MVRSSLERMGCKGVQQGAYFSLSAGGANSRKSLTASRAGDGLPTEQAQYRSASKRSTRTCLDAGAELAL